MPSSSSDLPLHLIGTRAFLPALLAYIRNLASSTSLPLDHVIFQSILLCLIAGDKHLILRAPEEDVGLTVKLVVWTLSCVFNLPTHKLKIRNKSSSTSRSRNVSPATDPSAFLRSLFLQSASSSNSNQTSQDEGSGENVNLKLFGHHHHRRQRSGGKHHKQKPHHEYSRSRSFPNNLAAAALAHGASGPAPPMADSTPESGVPPVAPPPPAFPSILKPQPIYPNRIPLAYTEPLPVPLPPIQTKSISSKTPLPVLQLPQALVISGLEHASDSIQRSLARVLGEKRVVLECERSTSTSTSSEAEADGAFARDDDESGGSGGVWNLPEGFITVYVCPWSARERPALHKSLLDKFAMSANVFVPQSVRRDFHLLPFASSSSPAAGGAGAGSRPFHPNFVSAHSNPGTPAPSFPTPLPPVPLPTNNNTPPIFTKSLPLHRRPSMHFNFNPPILPDEVIPRSFVKALQDARKKTCISYRMSLYLADIFSATRHHARLDAMLLTARAVRDAEELVRAARVVGNDLTGMELVRREDVGVGVDADGGDAEGEEDGEEEELFSKEYVRLSEDGSVSSQSGGGTDQDSRSAASRSASPAGGGGGTGTRVKVTDLDVTEVNVARIVPRVISHRVRLRNGPEDEVLASALFGATFKPPIPVDVDVPEGEKKAEIETAQSVKAVLVSILSEV